MLRSPNFNLTNSASTLKRTWQSNKILENLRQKIWPLEISLLAREMCEQQSPDQLMRWYFQRYLLNHVLVLYLEWPWSDHYCEPFFQMYYNFIISFFYENLKWDTSFQTSFFFFFTISYWKDQMIKDMKDDGQKQHISQHKPDYNQTSLHIRT